MEKSELPHGVVCRESMQNEKSNAFVFLNFIGASFFWDGALKLGGKVGIMVFFICTKEGWYFRIINLLTIASVGKLIIRKKLY